MKNILFTMGIVFCIISVSYSQSKSETGKGIGKYKIKSKNQRILGCMLIGGGVATLAVALPKTHDLDTYISTLGAGVFLNIGGGVLYLASIRNKKKARKLTAVYKMEKDESISFLKSDKYYFPTIAIKITF